MIFIFVVVKWGFIKARIGKKGILVKRFIVQSYRSIKGNIAYLDVKRVGLFMRKGEGDKVGDIKRSWIVNDIEFNVQEFGFDFKSNGIY